MSSRNINNDENYTQQKSVQEDREPSATSDDAVVFCKIFSDMVIERLCQLRRKELHAAEDLSCKGCIMDSLMNRDYSFMKSIILISRKGGDGPVRTKVSSEGQQ